MSLNLTDADAFTDPIVVPTSGDPRTSYGFLRTAFQGLANRTRYFYNRLGVANGIATLDGTGKVVQRSPGALVKEDAVEDFYGSNVPNATWVDVTGSTLSFTALVGDNVFTEAIAFVQGINSGLGRARILITDTNGSYTATSTGMSDLIGTTGARVALCTYKKSLGAGAVTVKLQLQNGGPTAGGDAGRMTIFQINIRQTRP